MWALTKTQMRVGKGKCWGVMPLVRCKVTIATSGFRYRLKYMFEKRKTALFKSTSQWCVNDRIYVKMRLPMVCCICVVWKKVDIRSRKHCWITGRPICVLKCGNKGTVRRNFWSRPAPKTDSNSAKPWMAKISKLLWQRKAVFFFTSQWDLKRR